MTRAAALGREAVAALLPHRAPLVLVDEVWAWSATPRPTLSASFTVPADHPVLAGHFPGRALWPGVYLVEGLAQAALVLGGLCAADKAALSGMLAAIDVRLMAPVMPGDMLVYAVEETHVVDRLRRFRCEAHVGERVVARGALTVALGVGP